ncbi:bifunctional UDP-N-acetylglucosamine diphosphorylase/glucosamine-1-phosphate N-acetyltransferase GlmU [soil metagenome]
MIPAMLNVVILAAGQGKRMVSDLPKVLHPLAGRPMLAQVVEAARGLDAGPIVIVVGHGGEQVRAWAAAQAGDARCVTQAEQLGTGHAVQQAVAELDRSAPTLVLYGDVPLVRTATLARLEALARIAGLALLTTRLPDPTGYGRIVRNEAGAVTAIVEHKDATDAQRAIDEVNTGILCVETGFLVDALARLRNDNAQGEYYLTDIVADAVAHGMAVGAECVDDTDEVAGINSKRQLADAERALQRRLATQLLDAGVTLADPARIDIRGTLTCGRDVFIDVGCVFEGTVELGDRVRLAPYCVIRNARFAAGSRAEAYSHVDGGVIGPGSDIGPYARIRPGTVLAERVHVGNFVEIKNATLANDTKAGHLSYLGDATIGERTNIGAGTITCNYDGANKHRTVIGDDVFIGSDSQLVAPVTVENGATLGAGTTLTKTAPAGELTVSRARQATIKGWQRPVKKRS